MGRYLEDRETGEGLSRQRTWWRKRWRRLSKRRREGEESGRREREGERREAIGVKERRRDGLQGNQGTVNGDDRNKVKREVGRICEREEKRTFRE